MSLTYRFGSYNSSDKYEVCDNAMLVVLPKTVLDIFEFPSSFEIVASL